MEVILCKILKSQFWAEYYQAHNEAQVLYLYKLVDRATDHGDNYWVVFVADFFVKPFFFLRMQKLLMSSMFMSLIFIPPSTVNGL